MQSIPNHLKLVHLYKLLAASYLLRVCNWLVIINCERNLVWRYFVVPDFNFLDLELVVFL